MRQGEPAGTLGSFLLPEGFSRPRARAMLRESSVVGEMGRYAVRSLGQRRPRVVAAPVPHASGYGEPVLLVPGFLAGDTSLNALSRSLRRAGFRTYRAHIRSNVRCTVDASVELEARLEAIAIRRGTRVHIVGHSLGGMLARGLAVRRPDLVASIVTLGSPMLAPGAHHALLTRSVEMLVRLSRAGVPGLMSADCVGGECARRGFDESRQPMPAGVGFTAVYSRRDGIVDWRACVDPEARAVEVRASHSGMAVDPRVIDVVIEVLRWQARAGSALEVDRGESA